jgi:phosphatidylinositol glycan class B
MSAIGSQGQRFGRSLNVRVEMLSKYLSINLEEKTLYRNLFIFSAVFHLIAIIFSEGFHRPDEHLGMLRLVYFKLGQYPASELSWEFSTMIRSWIQPGFYFSIAKLFHIVGLDNPFFVVFVLRLVTSSLGLGILLLISRMSYWFYDDVNNRKFFHYIIYGLWFLPFIHARSTTESFGSFSLILSLYFFLKSLSKSQLHNRSLLLMKAEDQSLPLRNFFLGGFFLGLMVNLRIPMAAIALFVMLWLIIYARINFKIFFITALGILASILLTIGFDSWGYDTFTYSTWNYIYQEFANSKSSEQGVSAWYSYFTKTLSKGTPPLSLFFILSFLFLWIKRPGSILTWCSLPFILLHSAIGHKELRFIFPIWGILPFALTYLYAILKKTNIYINQKYKKIIKYFTIFLIFENLIFMTISSFKPAYTPLPFYKYLYKMDGKIEKLYTLNVVKDKLRIYLKTNIPFEHIPSTETVPKILGQQKSAWFLMNRFHHIKEFEGMKNCTKKYMTYSDWVLKYEKYASRSKIWALYHCKTD